jgi:hypothetical protein
MIPIAITDQIVRQQERIAQLENMIKHAPSSDCGKALLAKVERYEMALMRIVKIQWGFDGDCGAVHIAVEALEETKP